MLRVVLFGEPWWFFVLVCDCDEVVDALVGFVVFWYDVACCECL